MLTPVTDANVGNYDVRDKAAPTDRRDEVVEQYERQLAERLALVLAAEFHRCVEEQAKD